MATITNYLYYCLGYEEEIKPDEKTVRQRHLVIRQIVDTGYKGLKLKPVHTDPNKLIVEHPADDFKVVVRKRQRKNKKKNQNRN
jgi:hypothetical protein